MMMWEIANIRLKIKIQKSSSNRCRSSWLDDPLLQSNFPWDESKAKPEEFNKGDDSHTKNKSQQASNCWPKGKKCEFCRYVTFSAYNHSLKRTIQVTADLAQN